MILYIFGFCALAWSTIRCEPPVNSYLPPSSSAGGRPSSEYGPPGSAGGGVSRGSGPRTSPGTQNQIQDNYLPPGHSGQTTLDTQYGVPSSQGFRQGSGHRGFGSSSQDFNEGHGKHAPDSQYTSSVQQSGPLSRLTNGRSNTQSGSGGIGSSYPGSGQRPDSSYDPPPTGAFHSSNDAFSSGRQPTNQRPGSHEFSSPLTDGTQGGFGGGQPSSEYGSPSFSGTAGRRGNDDQGSNFNGDDSNEPAKYQFSYDVDDPQTGTKFGHSEQRDGDLATGEYNVVLPDGRKQVVEYEAGLQGYKPQIRYEGGIRGVGGADGGQGYSQNSLGFAGVGFPSGDNGIGAQRQGSQTGSPARYQDANAFSQAESLSNQGDSGYPSGRPANGRPGLETPGFKTGPQQDRGGAGRQSHPNNIEGLNGGSQGYPRNGAQGNNGGFSNGGSPAGGGYPSNSGLGNGRGSQSNSRGSQSSGRGSQSNGSGGNGGEDGYPSGGPNGPRGSGY